MDQIFSTNRTNDAPNTNESDLIVVGYSSNLYRDDFTALKIESREHLIAWHGDSSLLIDRYDCRGYLNDLREFDNYAAHSQNHKLTKDEHELEELCDYERYLFLNEEDEEQPTDTINSQQDCDDDESNGQIGNYASIGYNYSEGGEKKEPVSLIADTRPVDTDVFIPEECLQLPPGIIFPKTLKINTIIMKTAAFVAKQGLQMEILLKAKQSANSQFDFLDYDDELNVYYKHVVQLIRDKKLDVVDYLSKQAPETEKVQNSVVDLKNEINNHNLDAEDDEDSDDDGYLHPSLLRPSSSECFEQSNNKAEKTPPPQETTTNDENKENEKGENIPHTDPKPPSKEDETAKIETPDDSVLRTIIDKLAEYVAKNGKEFEKQIIEKKDERFDFLRENHKYHGYYCSKIKEAKLKIESTKKSVETTNGRMNKKEDEQVHSTDCPKSKSPLKKPIDSDHDRKCNKRIKKDSESDANNITNYNSSSSSSKSSSRSSSVASVRKKSSSSETSSHSDSNSSSSSDESEKAKRKLKKRSSRSSSRHRHRDRKKSHSSKSSHHHHHHRHHSKKREKEKSKKSSSRKKYKKKRK